MPKLRVPAWWVTVGADVAQDVEALFAAVLADLPMSQTVLAEKLGVDQSTVARWANGKSTPSPEVMLSAVQLVVAHLEQVLEAAAGAESALCHLVAAEAAVEAGGFGAGAEHVQSLKEALDSLGGAED